MPDATDRSLPEDLLSMPGYSILESLSALNGVIRIVHGNGVDLMRWLDRDDHPDEVFRVWDVSKPQLLDHHLDEAERRLFNLVAAAHARVDFYRAVKKRGQLSGYLADEYDDRLSAMLDSLEGLHHWFMGTRNFMMHHRLPILRGQMKIDLSDRDAPSIRSTVTIDLRPMLRSSAFNAPAKEWMNSQAPDIDLRTVSTSYLSQLAEFDRWFGEAFAAHHVDECAAFLGARRQFIETTSDHR